MNQPLSPAERKPKRPPYRPPIGIPIRDDGKTTGALVSILLHALILALLLARLPSVGRLFAAGGILAPRHAQLLGVTALAGSTASKVCSFRDPT